MQQLFPFDPHDQRFVDFGDGFDCVADVFASHSESVAVGVETERPWMITCPGR